MSSLLGPEAGPETLFWTNVFTSATHYLCDFVGTLRNGTANALGSLAVHTLLLFSFVSCLITLALYTQVRAHDVNFGMDPPAPAPATVAGNSYADSILQKPSVSQKLHPAGLGSKRHSSGAAGIMTIRNEGAPESAHHYETAGDVPFEISKYWHQRHEIWSKYDDGIWMTDEAWFGVTPEPVANEIAEHVAAASESKSILIDAFAGAGGNVIAFARSGRWKQIFAVEKDPDVLACAKHNAELYGVSNMIWWIEGDVFEVMGRQLKSPAKNAIIFASPPWGGPSYTDFEVYDLEVMEPYPLEKLHSAFSRHCKDLVLYLPRTSDLRQLVEHAKDDERLEVTHYCMHGASKALCVFFGDFTFD